MKKLFLLLALTSCTHFEKKEEIRFNVGDKVKMKNAEHPFSKANITGVVVDSDDDKNDCYPQASYMVEFSVAIQGGVLKIPTILCPEELVLTGGKNE